MTRRKRRTKREIAKEILDDTQRLKADRHRRLKAFDIVSFNRNAERSFCNRLYQMLTLTPELSLHTVVQELSFDLDISPETAKRYLYKHTASRARFALRDGHIVLRDPPKEDQ